MKKYFTLLFILFSCFFLKAQEKKNEISIKVGYPSFGSLLQYLMNRNNANSNEKINIKTIVPLIFIHYKRSISKRWDLEGSLGYEKHLGEGAASVLAISKPENLPKADNSFISNILAGLSINFNYINREKFQLYSGVGISLLKCNMHNESDSYLKANLTKKERKEARLQKTIPFPHILFLGFRYGEKFGINSEIGIGYKGFANLGLSYKF